MPAYRTFVKETKKKKNARKRRYDGEAKEAEEALVQMKSGEIRASLSYILFFYVSFTVEVWLVYN